MNRCSGACCNRFDIACSPEQLAHEAQAAREGRKVEWSDGTSWEPREGIVQIQEMVVYLGPSNENHYSYTCKNWDPVSGNCMIHETRPRMCRDYGVSVACEHKACEWSGAKKD